MKKTILAVALAAISFGSFACQSCSNVTSGSTTAVVGGSVSNQIGTSASVGPAGGTSVSTATGYGASAAVAGGTQTGGSAYGLTGVAGVVGAGQLTVVGGTAQNSSTGSGTGYAYSQGSAGAGAYVAQTGSVSSNGVHGSGSGSYTLSGDTAGSSSFGVGAGANSEVHSVTGQAAGFVAAGGVAVSNDCTTATNFAGGAVGDLKGAVSGASTSSNGANVNLNGGAGSSNTVVVNDVYSAHNTTNLNNVQSPR